MKVDFATFCYSGDAHRLHHPGQLQKQVDSNNYPFDNVIIVYQDLVPGDYELEDINYPIIRMPISDFDRLLTHFDINLTGQYQSSTDKHHNWKHHVINHLAAILATGADYIVFADNDCWMVNQPEGLSWVQAGIDILRENPHVFIVSPNDGEEARLTQRMSQQMFLVNVDNFRSMDFNQPGFDFEVTNHPEMPEYHAMLEGRIHYHCVTANRFRYVLPPEYRYWHHNRLTKEGLFEVDYSKY